ncbi:hypothetical protein TCAP_06167 [Tolypocladium capitatum]|uniref:Uncharacterized protein n=1 Tax=Tolypocladium capitatum TaxID=45235 RepID=A0A2K3Q8U9_9HYPO|nr:hypothetical protein TCAP_06167 [Tolypocladium capitatum]
MALKNPSCTVGDAAEAPDVPLLLGLPVPAPPDDDGLVADAAVAFWGPRSPGVSLAAAEPALLLAVALPTTAVVDLAGAVDGAAEEPLKSGDADLAGLAVGVALPGGFSADAWSLRVAPPSSEELASWSVVGVCAIWLPTAGQVATKASNGFTTTSLIQGVMSTGPDAFF